ncbi:kinesin [Chloropicon primus]|uniref:Kinesin-like protein n=1 Tax=Chloropicon primus TaxID=1764295 RepID=A0A5B8MS23_9CHLO|nr:kinesin [Chloropicon primus]UPR02465.1 kinesin [Chloropicon primus]|mmetsp:Transcript_4360/g.12820  ORF Transcript_4360/g.12820 Transcript_4360/m.12820 type:complete len:982 (+) Transcript_4360:269-3214(+)|eukprot:QDZ23253.1 kinesin [Chloropicon primus]
MEQNKMYGSRIPRAPKRALKTLTENDVKAKANEENVESIAVKKPRLEESKKGSHGGEEAEWLEMCDKGNMTIDGLLGLKMTGKGKWDHKGRCEQMMPYIRQLRACTRYLRSCVGKADGVKEAMVAEHEKEISEREAELEKLSEKVTELGEQFAESKESVSEMKERNAELRKEMEHKHEVEMGHKVEISTLTNDLAHQKKVVGEKTEEIAKIQDNYVKSQEYAQNLQDFVKKLKEDTQKMNDSLLKIQEEKSELVSDLNLSKGNAAQLEERLQDSKGLVEQLQKQKDALNETLEAMKERHGKAIEEMTSTLKANEAEAKERLDALKGEKKLKEEELARMEGKHKEVCETLEKCEMDLKENVESLKESESKCEGLQTTIKEMEAQHQQELQAKVDQAQADKECFEKEKAALETSIEQKVSDLAETASKLSETSALLESTKAELQQVTSQFESTKADLSAKTAEYGNAMTELKGVTSKLSETSALLESNQSELQEVTNQFESTRTDLRSKTTECENAVSELQKAKEEINRYHEITGQSAENMEKLMEKSKSLEDQNATQNEVLEAIKAQYEMVKQKLSLYEVQNGSVQEQYQSVMKQLDMKDQLLREAEQKIHDGETLRKQLHNQILELKGNIRVFCRTRPLSEEEVNQELSQSIPTISYTTQGEKTGKGLQLHLTTNPKSKKRSSNGETHYNFDFDRSFQENASQEEVFEEISQLVQSALDGYKVCIFAYGQTGSGKTHTMIGNSEAPGMIPRSLEQIFTSGEKMKEQGWQYSISVSMMEIYNEEYKDLLGKKKLPAGKQHTVKHDQQGKTSITYMTDVKVTSMDKVNSLLNKAMSVRSVASTQCNEHSSRSHFVFRLNIEGTNEALGQSVNGVLNLVDLAGSERLSKSQATGDRLKETQSINKSLSALGDVIMAINNGDSHIPYRNSKLTWLLQPCLGNQSKALMFVNVAPSQGSAQETLCSLRFASKVNACEIGTAKRFVS